MITSRRIWVITLILFSVTVLQAKSFLWEVTKNGKTDYLAGSIHALRQQDHPLDQVYITAFEKSQQLVVEANINDVKPEFTQKIMALAMYPPNDSLDKHIPATKYKKIVAKAKKSGLPEMAVKRMKPFMIMMTFAQLEMMKLKASTELGVDAFFLTKASKKKMPIIELEGAMAQIQLLADMSDSYTDELIDMILLELKDNKDFASLIKVWKDGDLKKLATYFEETMGDKELLPIKEIMLDKRNLKMVEKIDKLAGSKKVNYIVVGAGHMIGKNGLVKLLEKKGYKVKQIGNEKK